MKRKLSAIMAVTLLVISIGAVLQLTFAPSVAADYTAAMQPGTQLFQRGASGRGTNEILNTSTTLLYYMSDELPEATSGGTFSYIELNGTADWDGDTEYYLWYPVYTGYDGRASYNLTWRIYKNGPTTIPYAKQVSSGSDDVRFGGRAAEGGITLNISGLWLIGPSTMQPNTKSVTSFENSVPAWFWVNTSTDYTISLDSTKWDYGTDGELTVTVEKDGEVASDENILIAAYAATGGRLVKDWNENQLTGTGTYTIDKGVDYFNRTGKWFIEAYTDKDGLAGGGNRTGSLIRYEEARQDGGLNGWNYFNASEYGNHTGIEGTASNYVYEVCGPWDPPEINATRRYVTVETGEPTVTISNTTLYWGFNGRIDVNVTLPGSTKGVTGGTVKIRKLGNGTYLGNDATKHLYINETGSGNYSIEIPRGADAWTHYSLANGTWYVVFEQNVGGNAVLEWNNTATFYIRSSSPPVRIDITDDGYGTDRRDKKVDIPTTDPTTAGPREEITVGFRIYGRAVTGTRAYYGDNTGEDEKNISITGDFLYAPKELTHTGSGRWTVKLTPSKPGGSINIAIDWPGSNNGSDSETIHIINGTNVVPSVESFTYGDEFDLTITVTDMDGDPVKTSKVYLFWHGGTAINDTTGINDVGRGANGEYTFHIKKSDQGTTAPKNITIAASWPNAGGAGTDFWGYSKVEMKRNHNMQVNVTPTTTYAGKTTSYDITVSTVDGNDIDTTDSTLTVAIYDEDGELVTGDDAWSETGETTIELDHTLSGGTFQIYAYNATHDSQGQNATITVTKYSVTSDPTVLAWLIDTDQNISFQVTPSANGTLRLLNMSGTPNASYVGQTNTIEIINGIGTLEGVNATTLGKVHYEFSPEDGDFRASEGELQITTAVATPSPSTIYLLEPTTVTITVKHPATQEPLPNVRVSLDNEENTSTTILSKIPNAAYTNANGQVTFALTAEASGTITIYLKNGSDPDNKYTIGAAARKTMTLDVDPSVQEEGTFTVTAKYGGVAITDAIVTITFNGETTTTTTGTATLTAPSVQTNLNYKVEATAPGYSSESTTILIVNQPKIFLTVPDQDVSAGESFEVVAGADDGNSAGIQVTFNGVTKTTSGNGVVKFTAPTEPGTYQITATKDGYISADTGEVVIAAGGIPGFEILTLIAAIGVAFILLRRRQH